MLTKGGKGGGMSGTRNVGLGEPRVAEVKAVRNAPGGVDRRVDVVIKDAGSTKREKASIYMHRKNTKTIKTGEKYEFELEKREIDKERGGSNRMSQSRRTYRCESSPKEVEPGASTFKSFGSGAKKNLGKWYNN